LQQAGDSQAAASPRGVAGPLPWGVAAALRAAIVVAASLLLSPPNAPFSPWFLEQVAADAPPSPGRVELDAADAFLASLSTAERAELLQLLDASERKTTIGVEDLLDEDPSPPSRTLSGRWAPMQVLGRASHCAADGFCVRLVRTCSGPCIPVWGNVAPANARFARRARFLLWPVAAAAWIETSDPSLVAALRAASRWPESRIAFVALPGELEETSEAAERLRRATGRREAAAPPTQGRVAVLVVPRLAALTDPEGFANELRKLAPDAPMHLPR
jgi:hypothetical protein